MKASTLHFENSFIEAKKPSDKLMIVLHGRGDSIEPFTQFDQELGLENVNFLLLRAPRKFLDGFSWYGEPPYQKAGVLKIRSKILDVLRELEAQGWKSENIFLFGFSQGCLVSADVALNYPKKLAGVIGISGYFHFFPRWQKQLSEDTKQTPWLFTHGHRDDVLPLKETKFGAMKLKKAGFRVDWTELNKKHVLLEEEYPLIRQWVEDKLKDFKG
ncbi:MAG: alpha/beta hydrolase [Pseudobdellovibrionaceae bacterium]